MNRIHKKCMLVLEKQLSKDRKKTRNMRREIVYFNNKITVR